MDALVKRLKLKIWLTVKHYKNITFISIITFPNYFTDFIYSHRHYRLLSTILQRNIYRDSCKKTVWAAYFYHFCDPTPSNTLSFLFICTLSLMLLMTSIADNSSKNIRKKTHLSKIMSLSHLILHLLAIEEI